MADSEWIERELTAVSDLHPAFNPDVWALREAEQAIASQVESTLDLSGRLHDLELTVADLQRTIAEQTRLLTRLLQAWTEGE